MFQARARQPVILVSYSEDRTASVYREDLRRLPVDEEASPRKCGLPLAHTGGLHLHGACYDPNPVFLPCLQPLLAKSKSLCDFFRAFFRVFDLPVQPSNECFVDPRNILESLDFSMDGLAVFRGGERLELALHIGKKGGRKFNSGRKRASLSAPALNRRGSRLIHAVLRVSAGGGRGFYTLETIGFKLVVLFVL